MKKILLSVLLSFGMIAAVPVAASAATQPPQTIVSGTVTGTGGSPVSGANVVVSCNGAVATDTTDSEGGYFVSYPAASCPNGSSASVSATKGDQHGSNNGAVNRSNSKLNMALVDVSTVPELGMLTGAGAVVLAGGAFIAVRRKQAAESIKS